MDKKEKKDLLKKYAREQTSGALSALPFSISLFKQLFDFLDEKLQTDECDDTLKYTIEFLHANGLPMQESQEWMRENGGYCDCEVLANIEDKIAEIE